MCDPIDDPELYLRAAEESGMKIRYVVDTHVHADYISGGRKLAESSGCCGRFFNGCSQDIDPSSYFAVIYRPESQ